MGPSGQPRKNYNNNDNNNNNNNNNNVLFDLQRMGKVSLHQFGAQGNIDQPRNQMDDACNNQLFAIGFCSGQKSSLLSLDKHCVATGTTW